MSDSIEERWQHFSQWYLPHDGLYCDVFKDTPGLNKRIFKKAYQQCCQRFAEKFPGQEFESHNTIDREELRDRILFLLKGEPIGYIFSPVKRFGQGNLWIYEQQSDGTWIDIPTPRIIIKN